MTPISRDHDFSLADDFSESAKIRKARVAHRCANASRAERGLEWARDCFREIKPGDQYAEGEINPYEAGGFAHERFCMSCAERGLM